MDFGYLFDENPSKAAAIERRERQTREIWEIVTIYSVYHNRTSANTIGRAMVRRRIALASIFALPKLILSRE